MAFENGISPPRNALFRRSDVIAQALKERLQRLSQARNQAERELAMHQAALDHSRQRMAEVIAEIDELVAALRQFEVTVEPALIEDESSRWERYRRRYAQANGQIPTVEFFPESRQQKQMVIAQVRNILKAFGSLPVREIHNLLRVEEGDVPSVPRLSQILSESEEFEADRSKGWSLKE